MTIQRIGLAFFGLVAGILIGGFCHTLLLDRVVMGKLDQSGLDPLHFGVKPIGETLAGFYVLYGFWLSIALFAALVYGFTRCLGAFQRWRKGIPPPRPRPRLLTRPPFMLGLLLGAVGIGVWNLRVMTDVYASAITGSDRYAVATASAVPEIRWLTLTYCGILIALSVAILLPRGIRRMRHINAAPAS